MTRWSGFRRLWMAGSLALALVAPAAQAQTPAAWDQKAVAALATKLATALKDLHVTVKKNPDKPAGSPGRRAQYQAREDVKLLVGTSQRLASQLHSGEDLDATLPTWKRLQSTLRDAQENGKRGQIPAPTLEKVVSVQALMDQIAPYYAEAMAGSPAGGATP